MKRIAVFASGGGTDFQSLIDAVEDKKINGEIVLFIGNRKKAYSFVRAAEHGIHAEYINRKGFESYEAMDKAILGLLAEYRIDLLVLAGCLLQLGQNTVSAYHNRIMNIHPSLIPSFCGKGLYGTYVHEAVIAFGAKVSGCTVHFIDGDMDTGPIILQKSIEVLDNDTPQTLQAKVLKLEHILLPKAVRLFCADRLIVEGRRVKILEDNV
ncbi:MAG: phosphoribosylglycinamide formyltransferase [Clostridia bacterium]